MSRSTLAIPGSASGGDLQHAYNHGERTNSAGYTCGWCGETCKKDKTRPLLHATCNFSLTIATIIRQWKCSGEEPRGCQALLVGVLIHAGSGGNVYLPVVCHCDGGLWRTSEHTGKESKNDISGNAPFIHEHCDEMSHKDVECRKIC
jgi:hypothetical protein